MPGTGRARVIELGRLARGTMEAYVAHYRGCYGCYVAVTQHIPRRHCDTGWQLAKNATKAHNDLARARGEYRPTERGEQLELF